MRQGETWTGEKGETETVMGGKLGNQKKLQEQNWGNRNSNRIKTGKQETVIRAKLGNQKQ